MGEVSTVPKFSKEKPCWIFGNPIPPFYCKTPFYYPPRRTFIITKSKELKIDKWLIRPKNLPLSCLVLFRSFCLFVIFSHFRPFFFSIFSFLFSSYSVHFHSLSSNKERLKKTKKHPGYIKYCIIYISQKARIVIIFTKIVAG